MRYDPACNHECLYIIYVLLFMLNKQNPVMQKKNIKYFNIFGHFKTRKYKPFQKRLTV